jgi:hypothetical protein
MFVVGPTLGFGKICKTNDLHSKKTINVQSHVTQQ